MIIEIITFILVVFSFLIFVPITLFLIYALFNEYVKIYLAIMGSGKKWYQKMFIFPAYLLEYRKRKFIKNNTSRGSAKNHVALVLANNYFPENISEFSIDCVIKLLKHLNKKEKNYRVYNKITSRKLKKVISDKNVESIFLFGHGNRHGVKVNMDETVYYCEFPEAPKRKIVGQFHCNHLKGKCLAEYGKKPIFSFVENKMQNQFDIDKQIDEIIERDLI